MSQLQHFLHLGPNLWVLANEIVRKIATAHRFYDSGKGQFHWVTSPMGLLGCPASFQHLMEGVLRNLQNVIVYIDDLLIHSDTHE